MAKPNCYECKHRRELIGDCHSYCVHPSNKLRNCLDMFAGIEAIQKNKLNIRADPHGIKKVGFSGH